MEREGTASLYHQLGLSVLVLERLPGSLHSTPVGWCWGSQLVALGGLVVSFPKPWGVYLAAEGCWIRSCLASQPHSVCSQGGVSVLTAGGIAWQLSCL